MKKLLALLLVLVMCLGVFASCGTPEPAGATLEEAKDYLYNSMKDKNDKATPSDYTVVAKLIMNNTTFNVTWTTDNENIVVKEKNANFYTIDVPDANATEVTYTLTATIKNAAGESIQVSFTPKLPVIANEGVITDLKENVAYKIFFRQVNKGVTLYALNTTQNGENKYIEADADPKNGADFYVEIAGEGYKFYTMIDGVKNYVHAKLVDAGNGKMSKYIGFATETDNEFVYDESVQTFCVTLEGGKYGVGTYSTFETISISDFTYFKTDNIETEGGQFPIRFMESAYAETLAPTEKPENTDPAADSTLTIAQAIELGLSKAHNIYTEYKYYITGTVKEISNSTYGNIILTDGTNDITLYGTYSEDGNTRFDALSNPPAAGDTITVYGIIGQYNNAPQMKNGWITGAVAGTPSTPDTPVEPEQPDTPVEPEEPTNDGTGYTISITWDALGATLYFDGTINGGRFNGTTDATKAVVVYLEAAANADEYLIYFYNAGTKTYVIIGDSSTGAALTTDAASATAVKWNEDNTTYLAADSNNNRGFGIDPTKTFTTFSCYDALNANNVGKYMFGQFTAVEGTEPDTPVEPEQPDTPVEPEQPDTPVEPEEPTNDGTGYTISITWDALGATLYFDGTINGGRFNGTTDATKAVVVYLEAAANEGEYLIYFYNGDTKTYVVIGDSSTGAALTTDAASATVVKWNEDNTTYLAADSNNNRGFGIDPTKTFTTFSCYDALNANNVGKYMFGQFTAVEA